MSSPIRNIRLENQICSKRLLPRLLLRDEAAQNLHRARRCHRYQMATIFTVTQRREIDHAHIQPFDVTR